jgi:hypothetical protein
MKSLIAGTLTVTAGLFAANMLGVAIAETTTSPPPRTISVQGVATVPIPQHSSAEAATAVYRQAMANAVLDGQSKASFLAGKVAATLGAAQTVIEGSGYINCTGGEAEYAEYEGGQPDFGSGSQVGTAVPPAGASAPAVRRTKPRRTKRKHPAAKKATAASCNLSAQVSLVYAIT